MSDINTIDKKIDNILQVTNDIKIELAEIKTGFVYLKTDFDNHKNEECKNIGQHYNTEHKGFWGRILIIIGGIITVLWGLIEITKKINLK